MKNTKIRPHEKSKMIINIMVPVALTLFGLAGGCVTVGSDYVSPATNGAVPSEWVSANSELTDTNAPVLTEWWTQFGDPVLNTLVKTALANNLDLEQARSRVREARFQRSIETAARFPTLVGSGTASAVKEGSKTSGELYATGFDASWEIDLFGSVRRRIEAATADAQATIETQRDIRISLLAELALNYIEYRTYEKRVEIEHNNIATLRKTLEIVQIRHEIGLADELQLAQAESNLASELSLVPTLKAGADRTAHRLAILIGQRPGTLAELLIEQHPVSTRSSITTIGIPADLLRRRPDIRRAEKELAAQSARVGVAKADLYPRFSFNGNLQFATADGGNLFNTSSRSAGIGPAFSWNIFNAGSVRNNIRIQNERQLQALLRYEQTILLALEEVENSLVSHQREQERRVTLKEAHAAAQRAADQAQMLYIDGLKDFIQVLDTQRILFRAKDQLILSEAKVATDLIRLYKALGGGWQEAETTINTEIKPVNHD